MKALSEVETNSAPAFGLKHAHFETEACSLKTETMPKGRRSHTLRLCFDFQNRANMLVSAL